jgi:hypothetical protein
MTKRKKVSTPSKTTTKSKQQGRKQTTHLPQKTTRQKLRRAPLMIIGLVSSLLGIFGFLFLVYPRVSVYPGESLNSHDPFQTPFIFKNDGYLPIFDINYVLNPEEVEDMRHNRIIGGTIGGMSNMVSIPKLNPNKTSPLFINHAIVTPPDSIKYASIYISIKYRPFLIPFTFTEKIRFKAERKNTGEYIWLESYTKSI